VVAALDHAGDEVLGLAHRPGRRVVLVLVHVGGGGGEESVAEGGEGDTVVQLDTGERG